MAERPFSRVVDMEEINNNYNAHVPTSLTELKALRSMLA